MGGNICTWLQFSCIPLLQLLVSNAFVDAAPALHRRGACTVASLASISQNISLPNFPTSQGDLGDDYSGAGLPASQSLVQRRKASSLEARASPLQEEAWASAISAGRKAWADLQKVLARPPSADPTDCSVSERWDVNVDTSSPKYLSMDWEVMGLESMPDPLFYEVSATAPKRPPETAAQDDPDIAFVYANIFSPQYNAIAAQTNYGINVLSQGARAPDRWSDVTYAYWRALCAKFDTDPADLKYILRQFITNEVTKRTILSVFNQPAYQSRVNYDSQDIIPLTPADDGFMALLKTPNVIGAVWMIMTYVNGLGRKTIKKITARRYGGFHLAIELGDYVPVAGATQPDMSNVQ